jgi:hypothetical protein
VPTQPPSFDSQLILSEADLWREHLSYLKQLLHFKHVFIIGTDFSSPAFLRIMQAIQSEEMRPFSLYLHRLKAVLAEKEYPHLAIHGLEKKKLALYPMIMVKCKDIGIEQSKAAFQVLIGPSRLCRGPQLQGLSVKRAVLIEQECAESKDYAEE